MKDSLPYRAYFVSNFRNIPENSHLVINTHSPQLYKFGSNRPKINGKMHEDQNIFRQFVGSYWSQLLKN